MGVNKVVSRKGNGIDRPRKGDIVAMEYSGYIYDTRKVEKGCRGKKFDSSARHGGFFEIRVGIGQVIKGWDEGIVDTDGGMTLGEKATLTITSDYAYAETGFPRYIPPNSSLIFDVELVAINGKMR